MDSRRLARRESARIPVARVARIELHRVACRTAAHPPHLVLQRSAAFALALLAGCSPSTRPCEAALWPVATTGADFDAFPAHLWCEAGLAEPLPEAWRAAFGGLEATRGVLPLGSDTWRHYVGQAAGRAELHLDRSVLWAERTHWLARRGGALPTRPFDLADPALVDELRQRVVRHARAAPTADFVSLCDEVGVTPFGDPVDFASAAATDTLLGLLAAADVDAFVAQRAEQRRALEELLGGLCEALRAQNPSARVALLGLSTATPFAAPSHAFSAAHFDVLEPYDEGLARERLFALARREQVLLRTVFTESAAATAWQVFEHALRGGDGVVLWQRRELAAAPAVAEELAAAIAAVRALRFELGARFERPSGVVVLVDERSDAAVWLHEARRARLAWPQRLAGFEAREGPAFRRRERIVALFEEAGASPGVLACDELDAAASQRFPLVVASGLDLADARIAAALAAHLARGGHIALDETRGGFSFDVPSAHERRVHRLPSGLDEGALRDDPTAPRALRRRAAAQQLLAAACGTEPPAIVAVDGRALFTAVAKLADGSRLVLALEAAHAASDRAALSPWRARCAVTDDTLEARWFGGSAAHTDVLVPAGWPALLVLCER